MLAMSIIVSDVRTAYSYSLLNRRLRPKPSEASLYNPGQARDLESALPSFDDLQFPAVFAQDLASQLAAFMSSVSNDCADVGK
jgi:hypothetical protein